MCCTAGNGRRSGMLMGGMLHPPGSRGWLCWLLPPCIHNCCCSACRNTLATYRLNFPLLPWYLLHPMPRSSRPPRRPASTTPS